MKLKELQDWDFEVVEISANVYRVKGIDSAGRSVERQGVDPEKILEEARRDALKLIKRNGLFKNMGLFI